MSMGEIAALLLVGMEWAVLGYFLLVNGTYGLQLVAASLEMRAHLLRSSGESRWRMLGSQLAPTISMLAPAYNEGATVAQSVRSLLALHYPNLEVIVINDGSKDNTLDVLKEAFRLIPVHMLVWRRVHSKPVRTLYRSRAHPNLVVVDKENGGKADALNAGLNTATGELVCAIDVDTLIESDALPRVVRPFVRRADTIAVGGTIRIANGSRVEGGRVTAARVPRRAVAGIQVVEYLRAFLFGRLGWNRLGGNLIISGAFGLFRTEELVDIGGWEHGTVGEDFELVVRLRRRAYEQKRKHYVEFIMDPVAWTEAPETLRGLRSQRERWHRGLADVLWRHRTMLLNPRYGTMGMLLCPYYFVVELLAPVVETIGMVGLVAGLALGIIDVPFALLFFAVAYGLSAMLGVCTLALESWSVSPYRRVSDWLWMLLWIVVESVGYRQLTVIWRLEGIWNFTRGKNYWKPMERRGFEVAPSPAAESAIPPHAHLAAP